MLDARAIEYVARLCTYALICEHIGCWHSLTGRMKLIGRRQFHGGQQALQLGVHIDATEGWCEVGTQHLLSGAFTGLRTHVRVVLKRVTTSDGGDQLYTLLVFNESAQIA